MQNFSNYFNVKKGGEKGQVVSFVTDLRMFLRQLVERFMNQKDECLTFHVDLKTGN